jgi:parvulin-like peptidyl-prolyl isomerase
MDSFAESPQHSSASPSESRGMANKKAFVKGVVIFIAGAVVVALGIGLYMVYGRLSTSGAATTFAAVLRLPIAKVNGASIPYSEYATDRRAIALVSQYDKAHNGPTANLTPEQQSDQVLWRLINNRLVADAASKYNVKLDRTQVDQIRQEILKKFSSPADADKELASRYGWNMDTYTDKVITQYVLQNQVVDAITQDEAWKAVVKSHAESVLAKLKAGNDFATLAKQYSEDTDTAAKGGELDWFTVGQGTMVPQFESAAQNLKKGEYTQQLVESPYGFDIIKLEDTKTVKEKDATTGKMVDRKQLKTAHIVFAYANLSTYLDYLTSQASVHVYGAAHNPFANTSSTPANVLK